MSTSREQSPQARLARLGFTHTGPSSQIVLRHPILEARLDIIRNSADPDSALEFLSNVIESGAADVISWDDKQWDGMSSLLGASVALGEHVCRHPSHVSYIAQSTAPPTRELMFSELQASVQNRSWEDALIALRIAYRKQVGAIAAVDVVARGGSVALLPGIAHALTDLADAVISAAVHLAQVLVPHSNDVRFAVIAMGKCGARELNYISDVDVMFVAEPADQRATDIAKLVMQACSTVTAEGAIWDVDANLRPEGKAGALVRTLSSYVEYYERWAQLWEYQALLKARPMAGDAELGEQFVKSVSPFVWQAAGRPGFVESVQAMRQRVMDHIPAKEAERELKLGRGGLRDVEFAVQLLQMVHGRSDVMVRNPNTLIALEQLATWGYVGRDDAATLTSAYRFLRTLEHRIQLVRMRRTHTVPTDDAELRRIGRSLGFVQEPVEELIAEWKKHAREVRRIHEKLFYRPLLDAVARLNSDDARLTPAAAAARLEALGYRDPEGALRHLEALTAGVTRRAAIQRTLLPVMLEWFAETADPDSGLFGFRRVSEALGTTPWFLRLLRDESVTGQRLATILGTSKYASDLLLRSPDSVNLLADDQALIPRTGEELLHEAQATVARHATPQDAVNALRAMRRRELFRISAAQLVGIIDVEAVGVALSSVNDAVISGAVNAISKTLSDPPAFRVIAMGRYGGAELGFGSDADVMFVYESTQPHNEVTSSKAAIDAHVIANELRTLLMIPSTDPELLIDADLRPEGKNGPLERSLDSYCAYYQRWSSPWESQALLRAAPAAGDSDLAADFITLIDSVRYPQAGLTHEALLEIRRLKARMESERLPRGTDPALHLKLGPGGLSDVEWVVQIVQMQHGFEHSRLRTTRTLVALQAASDLALIATDDVKALRDAWLLASSIRNSMMLVRGRQAESLPKDPIELSRLAHAMGYGSRAGQELLEDYMRTTRRSRAVAMRLLFGVDPSNA